MKDWIAARRADMKAQQQQAIGLVNKITGALEMLDAVEAELDRAQSPAVEPVPVDG